ncbi:uncharacterized protein [Palaemon carinicauda]|uniref:uncharacterized protein n=1 Tax=Palaemon carinicauda TaxID=392227 RepID=UPI0035B5AC15
MVDISHSIWKTDYQQPTSTGTTANTAVSSPLQDKGLRHVLSHVWGFGHYHHPAGHCGLVMMETLERSLIENQPSIGEPLPNVTWWSGSTLLDSEAEERRVMTSALATATPNSPATPYVTNTLHIEALTKGHLAQNLTCVAANTPVLRPLTASVFLRQTDAELLVSMDAPTGKLQGDHEYDVKCRAAGVCPPPIVPWWLRGNRLT